MCKTWAVVNPEICDLWENMRFYRLCNLNRLIFNFKIRADHKANRQQSLNKKERPNEWWSVWASGIVHTFTVFPDGIQNSGLQKQFDAFIVEDALASDSVSVSLSSSDSGSSRAHKLHSESHRVRSSSSVMWYPQLNYLLSFTNWTDTNALRIMFHCRYMRVESICVSMK